MSMPRLGLIALLGWGCNSPPAAPSISLTPQAPSTADPLVVVFDQESVDADDDPVDYRFEWSVDGIAMGDIDGDRVPADRTVKGQVWSVVVTPFDPEQDGLPASAEVGVVNSVPSVTVSLTPSGPGAGSEIRAETTTSDADEDPVSLRYAWTVDGSDAGVDGPVILAESTAKGQFWEVTVWPDDGEAEGMGASAVVEIGNSPPEIRSLRVSPDEVVESSVLTVVLDAVDPDDDPLTPSIQWVVNGSNVEGEADGSLTGAAFGKGDQIVAEVRVSDGSVDSELAISDAVAVLNTAPTAESAAITPGEVFEGTTVSVALAGFADVDGDPEGVSVQWLVNGDGAGVGPTLDGAAFDRGDALSCEARPDDGEVLGEAVICPVVVVSNSPPTLTGVSLSPLSPRTGDDVVATPGSTADVDGDVVDLAYAWTVNGIAAGTGTATLSASAHKKGDLIEVSVTPNDGTSDGLAQTASVSIGNTPPALTAVTLSPSTLRTDDTASVSWASTDVDGDSITVSVAWTVDGSSAGTGSTLGGSAFSKGEKVVATLTPNDGTDDGLARSGTLTVANTAPTAPTLSLFPATPDSSNKVECRIATAGTDADGDTLSYRFSWTKNGTALTGTSTSTYTGDTVLSSSTAPGDVLVCTVTAFDGTDSSPAVTGSATVLGAVVSGFSGVRGPTFSGWTQCEGYTDTTAAGDIPAKWGDDCEGTTWKKLRLVCGASTSAYRYIDVNRNVFRDKLTAYPQRGLILQARDHTGTSFSYSNEIYASGNDPYRGASWWAGPSGCVPTATNLTVNNSCTYEASNCFGQGLSGTRSLWIYVAP